MNHDNKSENTVFAETESGRIAGIHNGGVSRFLGVPYAAEPSGKHRFRQPRPAVPWTGVKQCHQFGPIPMQPRGDGPHDSLFGLDQPQSEDCLNLNIWTPAADQGKRAVMVWLYGGGFDTGAGSAPWTDGSLFALEQDVVIVTANYRVGLAGWWYLEPLLGSDYADAGNAGFCDCLRLLYWIQANIGNFGGDPNRVTVFGESAGGALAMLLATSPHAKGLVHRAIVQSAGVHVVHDPDDAVLFAEKALSAVGLDVRTAPGQIERLPAEKLFEGTIAAAQWFFTEHVKPFEARRFRQSGMPVADGRWLGHYPAVEHLRHNPAPHIPLLCGSNRDELQITTALSPEAAAFYDGQLSDVATGYFGDRDKEAISLYRAHDPDRPDAWTVLAFDTDRCVRIPTIRMAEAHRGPTYMYWFTRRARSYQGNLGAGHTVDIPYAFGLLNHPEVIRYIGEPEEIDFELSRVIRDAWGAFARTGDPSCAKTGNWPVYDLENRPTMELGDTCGIRNDPWGETRELWNWLDG